MELNFFAYQSVQLCTYFKQSKKKKTNKNPKKRIIFIALRSRVDGERRVIEEGRLGEQKLCCKKLK